MGLGGFFKKVGKVALAATQVAGLVGIRGTVKSIPVVSIALETIAVVEDMYGSGKGKVKKETAKQVLAGSLKAYERLTKTEIDEDFIVDGLDPLIESLVAVANELDLWNRILPKE